MMCPSGKQPFDIDWHRESTGSWSREAARAVLLEQARWIGEQE